MSNKFQNLNDELKGHVIVENKTAYDSIGDDAILEIRNTTSGSQFKSFIIGDERGRFIIKTEKEAEPVVYQPDEGSVGYGVYDPEATVHIRNIDEEKRSHLMIQNKVNNVSGQALFELRTTTTTHDYRSFIYNKQDGKFVLSTNLFGIFLEKTGEMTEMTDFIGTNTATITFLEEQVESTTRLLEQNEISELCYTQKFSASWASINEEDEFNVAINLPNFDATQDTAWNYTSYVDNNNLTIAKFFTNRDETGRVDVFFDK